MITRNQLEKAFNKRLFAAFAQDIDHTFELTKFIREKVPFDVVKSIVTAAQDDILFLVSIDTLLPYLEEKDIEFLVECNAMIHQGCLAVYV